VSPLAQPRPGAAGGGSTHSAASGGSTPSAAGGGSTHSAASGGSTPSAAGGAEGGRYAC